MRLKYTDSLHINIGVLLVRAKEAVLFFVKRWPASTQENLLSLLRLCKAPFS